MAGVREFREGFLCVQRDHVCEYIYIPHQVPLSSYTHTGRGGGDREPEGHVCLIFLCTRHTHAHTHTHAHSLTRTHTYTPGQLAAVTGLGIAQADEMLDRAGATVSQTSSLWKLYVVNILRH